MGWPFLSQAVWEESLTLFRCLRGGGELDQPLGEGRRGALAVFGASQQSTPGMDW